MARRFDLNGRTMNDEVFADMYGEQLGDLFNAWKNATDNKHPETVYTDVYPQNLVFFEKRLVATGNGLLAGDEVTWADIYLSQMIDFIADKRDQVLKAFPRVRELDDRIRSHPNIKAYLKIRIDN